MGDFSGDARLSIIDLMKKEVRTHAKSCAAPRGDARSLIVVWMVDLFNVRGIMTPWLFEFL